MGKRFKLRLSIPSFQLCRSSKIPFSFPKYPSPAPTLLFSPLNPKAFEIAYPVFPDPPPTTPTTTNIHNRNPFSKRNLTSKISPLNSFSDDLHFSNHHNKTCNSPVSFDESSDVTNLPISPPFEHKTEKLNVTPADVSSCDISTEETGSLFSSSTSFDATSSSFDFSNYSGNKVGIKKTSKNVKARKLKRYASNKDKLGTHSTSTESEVENDSKSSSVKKTSTSVLRRLMMTPCAVEGKVKESFAVVTKSDDPYEDFKRSMLEMILEKQMFEAKELEELLHCFLSLNSRHHHAVIVAAFTEIWEVMFL